MSPSPAIAHSRPTLNGQDARVVARVVRSGRLAQGAAVAAFERRMAAYVGVRGGVAVNSGTTALELALLALGIGRGDEVILPSYVCAAPWLAVHRAGAVPKLVDIEPDSYAIDPARVKKALTRRTRAVIVPHLFGLPADLTRLQALHVPLIEDCAQTLGVTERGRKVGSVGAATVCSFYATKLLCTGEGGMLLSRKPVVLEKGRVLREYDEEPLLVPGSFNRKMTDLQAALGLSQLRRLRQFLRRRRAIAAMYRKGLAGTDVTLPAVPRGRTHCFYRYVVRLRDGRHGTVEKVMARLERRGVQCRRPVFRPLHQYLRLRGFPESEEAHRTALSLPIYPSMSNRMVRRVIMVLNEELA
jgi:dTDP-4-amino-4,6-dideoxygalactose transaminase